MNRREFLTGFAALSGLMALGKLNLASAATGEEQYWVFVSANGGWDTAAVCDPKGDIAYSSSLGNINPYSQAEIRQAGALRFAPLLDNNFAGTDPMAAFFNNQYNHLQVFNGLDYQTNSHQVGIRASMSGHQSPLYPVTAAVIASLNASQYLMPFYLGSGYGNTANLVNASRLNDLGRVQDFTNPERYLTSSVMDLVNSEHQAAMAALGSNASEAEQLVQSQFAAAHLNGPDLKRLLDKLPASPSTGDKLKAEIAAASFAAGLSNTAAISIGIFDTHSDHDSRQTVALVEYFEAVNHLIAQLEQQGIADRTTLVLTSDFGRTPYYNSDKGKDHWNVGSTMIWSRQWQGNRVIGATDNQLKALKVDPETLELSPDGVVLTQGHIHAAIRQRMGISMSSHINFQYPLGVDLLQLFT
ncbi:DUF1501 domain-containing protein [Shewanella sp. JBTF-M18]|uniref:DUF1501 domain-containing protein n=1 Tax=Shewanella insulae TaxID=2681496 RepID=A0A6L7I2P9_9GAMM|nr:DUF1501 domain-containing protein [Shewanella insulae]MXR69591.1 DUF1501 domain-containing protein [Shewanella insulae]